MSIIVIHVDGGTGGGIKQASAAAVARTQTGEFMGWLSERLPGMTNNEAEYHAVLLGLNLARQLGFNQVKIVSDSEVIVRQMQGLSRVMSAGLKLLHRDTCALVRQFKSVVFQHVPREYNQLADALASEALQGRTVRMPKPLHQKRFGLPTNGFFEAQPLTEILGRYQKVVRRGKS